MSNRDYLFWLADELGKLFHPLEVALSSEEAFTLFLEQYGWVSNPATFDINDVRGVLDIVNDLIEVGSLTRAILTPSDDVFGVESTIELVSVFKGIAGKVRVFSTLAPPSGFAPEMWDTFTRELLDGLVADYLERHQPLSLAALTIMAAFVEERVDVGGAPGRINYVRREIHWQRIGTGVTRPGKLIREVYAWDHPTLPFDFEFFLDRLGRSIGLVGLPTELEIPSDEVLDLYYDASNPQRLEVPELAVTLINGGDGKGNTFDYSLKILPIPPIGQGSAPPNGLVIRPLIAVTGELPEAVLWPFSVEFSGFFESEGSVKLEVQPEQITTVLDGAGDTELDASLAIFVESESPQIVAGTVFSHRLQLFGWKVGVHVSGPVEDLEFTSELSVDRLQLLVDFTESDGFLSDVFGNEIQTLEINASLLWSSKTGIHFRGQSALELVIPIHRSLRVVEVETATLGVRLQGDRLEVATGLTGNVTLGPVVVRADNVGVRLLLEPLEDDKPAGAFGNLDVDFDFKPPDGLGLTINGGGFKGGGLLDFEPDNQRYVGFLELEFKEKITLKALGLLTTSLPDGSDGYSLLIIITAEFNPIQLGLGFTLNGVGGLLGLHRTAKVERLRTGVKDNTLSSILFPQDIVANADRIISDLRQVFPVQQDRFIFGPMAKIEWGTPTLITIDLGLMLEVPSPVRLYILGVVRAQIPNEEERKKQEEEEGRQIPRVLQLQVNFLGVVDFDAQRLAFDASLYDSKLLTFILSGDMAVRFSWGSEPNFLLTVGGFHPAYEPPPLALPTLQRLTLPLLSGANPRLIMETYFAITSNTVQFGARLELYATKSKFNVSGFLSYDVLFQFNPFYFIADIGAMLALRVGSRDIASISLSLALEGPTPWHARGTAKFKICWFFTLKLRFNKTFGEESDTRLDDVAVLPLLQAALSNKGNWEVQLPSRRHALVSLRESEVGSDEILVDPSGVLSISQKVVPLNVTIAKFGNQQPADAKHFAIERLRIGPSNDSEDFDIIATQESFAPAQFFEKSDAQKLASKSFERYDSGVELSHAKQVMASYAAQRPVAYELFYIDEQRNQRLRRRPELLAPDLLVFDAWSIQGAIAGSPLSFAGNARSALAPDAVQVSQEQFSVVNISDLRPLNEQAFVDSEAGAYSLMSEMIHNNPALEGELQVVPGFEVSRVN